jgi:hypothetical protein
MAGMRSGITEQETCDRHGTVIRPQDGGTEPAGAVDAVLFLVWHRRSPKPSLKLTGQRNSPLAAKDGSGRGQRAISLLYSGEETIHEFRRNRVSCAARCRGEYFYRRLGGSRLVDRSVRV